MSHGMCRMSQETDEQAVAIEKILDFLGNGAEPFFVLSGAAGTGKTFILSILRERYLKPLIFTAPTNKAAKVLRSTIREPAHICTTHSFLNLKMQPNGEVKELVQSQHGPNTWGAVVVVDECSMVNSLLMKHIKKNVKTYKMKFIFVGDRAQLPPVGEAASEVWEIENDFVLVGVRRHGNSIMNVATAIREGIDDPSFSFRPENSHCDGEGVVVMPCQDWWDTIRSRAKERHFHDGSAKILAWRNATVKKAIDEVRQAVYGSEAESEWIVGERIVLTEPAFMADETIFAHTEDEGVIEELQLADSPFKIWLLRVNFGSESKILRIYHSDSKKEYDAERQRLAAAARADKLKWKEFWSFVNGFQAARPAYATTVHRSQGSTYDVVFAHNMDILCNSDRAEAARCLYVAATRPRKELFLIGDDTYSCYLKNN